MGEISSHFPFVSACLVGNNTSSATWWGGDGLNAPNKNYEGDFSWENVMNLSRNMQMI
jgi:hypothetical protein